ncbi:hypothetical protein BJV38_004774 [Clostridium beijerinckii]|uniref:hypothetical protein n=1 Tax=Clostridium beijerinckii TaxID=1520 RepID=UPI0015708044|nr:hypothetical protein [Clostridium beijerinckii]NRT32641.1 hypothetical protein [Clostridium beijerinckii]NRT47931.1 hypothetical protein [Clostridium beijerinckii]NRZ23773.1 hypothetical protein [Clostridium beijerinckii]
MDRIRKSYNRIKQFISNNDVEMTAFISAFFIVYASFLINKILAFYILGVIFGGIAIFLLKYPKK